MEAEEEVRAEMEVPVVVENKYLWVKLNFVQLITFCSVFLFNQSYSQFGFYTDVSSYYDDNIFNNYLAESDFIHSFSLGTEFDVESETNNLNLYYDGNFTFYNEYSSKSSGLHKAGVVNTYFVNDENPMNIGINYNLKKYGDDFDIYDWNSFSVYANYRHYTGENDFILAGYIFNRIKYQNLDIFSFNEHKGLIKFQLAFKTRTTLLLSGEAGYKDYIQQFDQSGFTNSIWQISSFLRIAQALGDNTGMSVFAGASKNFKEGTRYLSSNDYYYFEEELLNDQYSSDGFEGGMKITQLVSPVVILSGYANFTQRNYTNLPAADLEGNPLNDFRTDNRLSYGVTLEVSMGFILTGLFGNVSWNNIHNNSNDPFYDYNNQIFAAGLEFGL